MRLGFAVKVLGDGGLPTHDARRWQSGPHLRHSLERSTASSTTSTRHDIRHVPHDRVARAVRDAPRPAAVPRPGRRSARASSPAFGARARELGIRLSTHPGQYIVLNSENPAVRDGAVRDVELQARLLDAMGLGPEAVVRPARRRRRRRPRRGASSASSAASSGCPTAPARGSSSRTTTARSRSPTCSSCTRAPGCASSGTSCTTTATTRTGSRTARRSRPRSRPGRAGVHAEDPLLVAQDGDGGAQEARRAARRALAGSCRSCAPTPT